MKSAVVAWPIILIPAIWQFWYPNITCIHCDHASVAAERRFKTRVAPSLFCSAVRINTRNFRLKRNYSQFLGKMNKHFWILHWYTPEKFSRKSYLPVKIFYKLWSQSILFHITIIAKLFFRRMNQSRYWKIKKLGPIELNYRAEKYTHFQFHFIKVKEWEDRGFDRQRLWWRADELSETTRRRKAENCVAVPPHSAPGALYPASVV